MTRAYYNEIDRFNCDWLSNLMDAGLITPGKIDDRSIVDVRPDDVAGFERAHFFAGIGGWDYSLELAGWLGPVWTGSRPCQPFSLAGKQKGFADDRHLWPVWRELIRERRPAAIFGEQVASATEWLGLVRGDLEAMGYAVGAIPCEAASAGADHLRDRYWFVGHALDQGKLQQEGTERAQRRRAGDASDLGDSGGSRLAIGSLAEVERGNVRGEGSAFAAPGHRSVAMACPDQLGTGEKREQRGWQFGEASSNPQACDWVIGADGKARRVKSGIRLLAHGVPNRVGLLRGFGNAIDPRPAAASITASALLHEGRDQ